MRYRWAAPGDLNAFFGLMLDNVMNLVILAGILIGVFGFPRDVVYTRMFPGTALGVLFGDLVYTWMASRLARREGRTDVTAMPLGIGPAVAMNWSNAAFWTFGGSVTRGAATFYPIFSARFPMAWFGMFGGTEFSVPYLYMSAPLIAIGYLIWRGIDSTAAG